jgi:Predicted membrane protein (DUF2142)
MANPNPAGPPPHAWEWKVVLWLCLLAAIHVYIFSTVFPFFNNVDEATHFDLVVKYARGDVPRRMELYTDESVKYYVLYGSPVYLAPDTNYQEFVPQPWKYSPETRDTLIRIGKSAFVQTNYESSQPPLYYALAGACWRASGGLKLDGGTRLYELRFLNILIICLLVWLGWYTARQVFPDNIFPRLGVPAFITFMPQSAFYSIQNDTLSPLCFGVAFVCLLRLFQTEIPGWRLGALTGVALAATFLTKMTNVPLLAVSIVALAALTWRLWREAKLRKALRALSILTACAALPALAWICWCRTHFGDFTGSQPKVLYWGWTPKPVSEWLQHPIFTFHGAWIFVSGFLSEFWQGEIKWYKQPLCLPAVSWFYECATIILLLVTLAKIIRHPATLFQAECRALRFSFFLLASAIAFLVYISIRFDFHNCNYPSRTFPYLISGRLVLGALIPFMLLFVSGLDQILQRFKLSTKFIILAALNLAMLIAEFVTDQLAFLDKYNWYHM